MADDRAPAQFYEPARLGRASDFGREFGGLAIANVKEVGHRFRLIQADPLALQLEEERRSTNKLPERVNQGANFLPVCFLEIGMRHVRAVCKIETKTTDAAGVVTRSEAGTGFLVAPNLLLTNNHVIDSLDTAKATWCLFNYQLGPDFTPLDTVGFRLDPQRLFVTSPYEGGLDYTFVWIESAASAQFGFVELHRSAFTVHPGDYANLIQHPAGRQKEIVLQDNQVIQDTGLVLHYTSDTEPGSSGSPVFNNRWELIALHHASVKNTEGLRPDPSLPPPTFLNEGIKISAIAADLERRVQRGEATAATALAGFRGVDSLLGFFGGLGRHPAPAAQPPGEGITGLESIYSGEGEDFDVGIWNVEWFTDRYEQKLEHVAAAVADLNVDVWVLLNTTAKAARGLVGKLRDDYELPYDLGLADTLDEDDADAVTAVMWNTTTVAGERLEWPRGVDDWFRVRSAQFADLAAEPVQGPLFERYPARFRFSSAQRPLHIVPFEFSLVPLQLDAVGAESGRRRMASRVLAAAINRTGDPPSRHDWLLVGSYNAAFTADDLRGIFAPSCAVMAAEGEGPRPCALTYLRSTASALEHMYASTAFVATLGATEAMQIARDRELPLHVKRLSEQWPAMMRLTLRDRLEALGPLPRALEQELAEKSAHRRRTTTPQVTGRPSTGRSSGPASRPTRPTASQGTSPARSRRRR